jgi:hypothetical protein
VDPGGLGAFFDATPGGEEPGAFTRPWCSDAAEEDDDGDNATDMDADAATADADADANGDADGDAAASGPVIGASLVSEAAAVGEGVVGGSSCGAISSGGAVPSWMAIAESAIPSSTKAPARASISRPRLRDSASDVCDVSKSL